MNYLRHTSVQASIASGVALLATTIGYGPSPILWALWITWLTIAVIGVLQAREARI